MYLLQTESSTNNRGFTEGDFVKVGDFIIEVVELSRLIQNESGKKLVDFKNVAHEKYFEEIARLKNDVNKFAETFEFIED